MDDNERVTRCRLIAGLLVADDWFDDSEQAFLDRTMDRMGLSEEERKEALRVLDADEAEAAVRTLSDEARRELLSDLVAAADADGVVDEAETEYLQRIAAAMGLSDADIDAARG